MIRRMSTMFLLMSSLVIMVSFGGVFIRSGLRQRTDFVDWFVMALGSYAGVGCLFIIWYLDASRSHDVSALNKNDILFIYPGLSLLAIFMIWAGASIVKNNKIDLIELEKKEGTGACITSVKVAGIAWGFLVFAVISYWIYARPFGGFVNLLSYTSMIRSGLLEGSGLDTSYSFLKRFGGFAFFATLLFWGMILSNKALFKAPIHLWIGFILAFFFSVYVLYSWGGRIALLSFIAVIPLGFYFSKNGYGFHSFLKVMAIVVAALVVLPVSSALWGKDKEVLPIAEFYVKELSFPLHSFTKGYDFNEYRLMKDVFLMPTFVLPKRIWSGMMEIETVSNINTRRVMGHIKGEYGVTGTTPVDFINLGMIQGGAVGVMLVAFLFGYFLAQLDKWILVSWNTGFREVIYGYAVVFIVTMTVLYSDPQHIMIRNFHFIAGVFIIKYLIGNSRNVFFSLNKR